jgi:hypothetical protein
MAAQLLVEQSKAGGARGVADEEELREEGGRVVEGEDESEIPRTSSA